MSVAATSDQTGAAELQAARVPALMYFHIPLEQYASVWTPQCGGLNDDGVTPVVADGGLYAALQQQGDVRATFVGHDHGNTWCCAVNDTSTPLSLCYGRHSGYGGYGDWARGARVVQLQLLSPGQADWTWSTWVRLEDGTILPQ